jgi:hypothetical protein
MIRPEEPLIEYSKDRLKHMVRLGEAAYAYGLSLHAQMQLLPERMQPPAFEMVVMKAPAAAPVEPMEWPGIHFMANLNGKTQEEIASIHTSYTGDDFHQLYVYGGRTSYHPRYLKRLVGFVNKRGGARRRSVTSKKA